MRHFDLPTNSTIHAAKAFIEASNYFGSDEDQACLNLDPKWMNIEPFSLAMAAAWGAWCQKRGIHIEAKNLASSADYVWRMKLFDYLPIQYAPQRIEHEEAGRFLPIKNVRGNDDIKNVIADISALLHMQDNPDGLAAVQYCISELLRNSLEHSNSESGAFVCAQYYSRNSPRVSIGVADCGIGIAAHLGRVFPEAQNNDKTAIELALRPGVTGAIPGMYGTPDNAGAGLFITRSIAKGCGGYFMLYSGKSCYRLRRAPVENQTSLFPDALLEPHDLWDIVNSWRGTVIALEILIDRIEGFDEYFSWIRRQMNIEDASSRKIKFT